MVSKLAKQQIEKFQMEGLKPTFDDIVLLNNLGLQVERGTEMYSFSACPRMAFLGDNILRQPTIAKQMWIDQAQCLFAETLESRVYILAYALGTPDDSLPSLSNQKEIKQAVLKFRDDVLINYTDTQIMCAIDYVLNGIKPDLKLPPDATDEEKDEIKKLESVYDIPDAAHSMAKQLLLQAMSKKIPAEVANFAMIEDLEHMIAIAAMTNGVDVLKNEHTKRAGNFYVAAGRIHERLTKEKENGKA